MVTVKPAALTPAQAEHQARKAKRNKKTLVINLLASTVVGVVVAALMTWRGAGIAAALKMWALCVAAASVLSMAMTQFLMSCAFGQSKTGCLPVALVGLAAIPAVLGMTIGTALRLLLVAAGR